ncbi:MAG: hypothetical protein KDJ97_26145 [Anaerolineae bacterium]|nr:hypothetical protein [Anaerolineae bacterium]
MYGPLEYVVIGFDGNRFTGEILPKLIEVEQQGCVRVVDLVFLSKNEAGDLTIMEISDLSEEDAAAYEPLVKEFHGLLTAEDVATIAADLPENTSAAVALFEHRWAMGLQWAVKAAGGQMLDSGFVHPEAQAEVIAELKGA